MKTATITFHASHNYGSMLQAYALQQVLVNEVGVENEILNLRTDSQDSMYPSPKAFPRSLKGLLIWCLNLPIQKQLYMKYLLFEKFLSDNLILSPEFKCEDEVTAYAGRYDYLISGSDQIWNTICVDFDWSYYLPFAKNNAIAYAPSMGPYPHRQVREANFKKINECLKGYKSISVRETATAEMVKEITGIAPPVMIDPTMLLDGKHWDRLAGTQSKPKNKYIFFYSPFYTMELCDMAYDMSKHTGLPIVVSNKLPTKFRFSGKAANFNQILDCGPIEFLGLIKNAEFVISGSFHAVVFSLLYHRPFLAYKGDSDSRMRQILSNSSLLDYAFDSTNYLSKINLLNHIDFSGFEVYVSEERERSLRFLKDSLDL